MKILAGLVVIFILLYALGRRELRDDKEEESTPTGIIFAIMAGMTIVVIFFISLAEWLIDKILLSWKIKKRP